MCGIVGAAGAGGDGHGWVAAGCDALSHRGPDDAGGWTSPDARVALGHRRLSIIDLSPAGHQPMADGSGELHIAFNGEIYNFRELRDELRGLGAAFRSGTDTEVVLAAYRQWGADAVRRLEGMFALALWDSRERRLLLARDRAGEKPLFYRLHGGRLAFASELKALMADPSLPRRVDRDALEWYLAFGYVPGERCMLQGVSKLPPGCLLTFGVDDGHAQVRRYWDLPAPAADRDASSDAALEEELEALLERAVSRQLVADVPVGVLLSGGIDSSLVTAMAARAAAGPVRTFTVSFPGHGGFDEAPYARAVASHFGTRHTELQAEPASVELLPQLARQYDEPMADSSMVPTYLVSRLIRQHATVALGGDGGDELFGGYTLYGWVLQQEKARRLVPRPLRRAAGAVARAAVPVGVRGRNYVLGYAADLDESIASLNRTFEPAARRRLLAPLEHGAAPRVSPEADRLAAAGRGSAVQRLTRADFRTYLPDDILVKVDRASMLTSLEVRAPFLDPSVIEFAYGRLPDHLRATAGARKVILRRLAARILPPALDLTRKQGFSIPFNRWFSGGWGEFFHEVLTGPGCPFDPAEVARLLAGQRKGRSHGNRLFALVLFELWRREYGVSV